MEVGWSPPSPPSGCIPMAEKTVSKTVRCEFDSHHPHMGRPHNHPSLWCYKAHGCRCDECTVIYVKDRLDWILKDKTAIRMRKHNHPSLNCYKSHGCRCVDCIKCMAEANRKYYKPKPKDEPRLPSKRTVKILPPEEVERLRKLVGYHENVT